MLYYIINHRRDFGKVIVLYGARTPNDLQFTSEYKAWQDAQIELQVTVDRGDDTWQGRVGVVPILFYNTRIDPHNTVIMTCGPEVMIRFVIFEALARRVPTRTHPGFPREKHEMWAGFLRSLPVGTLLCM